MCSAFAGGTTCLFLLNEVKTSRNKSCHCQPFRRQVKMLFFQSKALLCESVCACALHDAAACERENVEISTMDVKKVHESRTFQCVFFFACMTDERLSKNFATGSLVTQ